MSTSNRHTVFLEDAVLHNDVGHHSAKPTQRVAKEKVAEDKPALPRGRFPVSPATRNFDDDELVPVRAGSPWIHYERKYRVRYGCAFGVITSCDIASKHLMIRTISGRHAEEQVQKIRQIRHQHIVHNVEIFAGLDSSYFLISEFMPTSLLHICRSPVYPTEPQLSSILYQACLNEFIPFER